MSDLGAYTFLPWLRQGISNRIDELDLDDTVQTRASVQVKLKVSGDPVEGNTKLEEEIEKDIGLYGPGDIVGIDSKAIIKVEPGNWITNFETNYLPYIEFHDKDFPWRYTPAAPSASNTNRLRPWIMLVVLKEGEFEDVYDIGGRPLPFIKVSDASVFPPSGDLWAWAHVHVNKSLIEGQNMVVETVANAPVLAKFEQTLKQNPDLAYSRIVSPRKLEEKAAYHAFLMPVFETGRLAGLGLDPSTAPFATHCAWDAYPSGTTKPEPTHFPIYHRWYFRTSIVGDFEYLVRLLKPKPMDSRVGRRDMDMQRPGANLPGIEHPTLGEVLKLGGALQIPFDTLKEEDKQDVLAYESWDQPYPHHFQEKLAAFINLADNYRVTDAQTAKESPDLLDVIGDESDPDPLITPPIYGRWHAKAHRLLKDQDGNALPQNENWVHELNLDPRFRVAAGFGADVVKRNQEAYMEAAWAQIGDVLRANQQIRWAQLAKEVNHVWYDQHLKSLRATNSDKFFALTAPVDKRILVQGTTRFHATRNSVVPRIAVSAPMRRIIRPRTRLVQKLGFPAHQKPEMLAVRLNEREVLAAPRKVIPESLPTLVQVAEKMEPGAPEFIKRWTRSVPWLNYLTLMLGVLFLVVSAIASPAWTPLGFVAVALAAFFFFYLNNIGGKVEAADSLREENLAPELVDELPASADFRLTRPGEDFRPSRGGSDSAEAARFKVALRDTYGLIQASRDVARRPAKVPLNMSALVEGTFRSLDPELTVPKRTLATVFIPPRIRDALFEVFDEAMAYPEFDIPMYKPLAGISAELFLPNMRYIEQDSISLVETNQRFIEAYMVGLNHEFGRELLWREFPTDQRGSYFRQFWDVGSFLDRDGGGSESLRERLRDIPPLHRWSRPSNLGEHDHRQAMGEHEELVLVIRGELLKKYPTAVIFAHRSEWQRDNDGKIDKTKPRSLVDLAPAEAQNPPPEKVRTPLYEAKVEPDVYFFGFDLTSKEAKGETEEDPDDPGWFFVIKERPGEPRFGFDIDQEGSGGGTKSYWNDFSWQEVLPSGEFLQPTAPPATSLVAPPASATDSQMAQHTEDLQVTWTNDVSAAELAYIMYQVPVLVAVHAAEMLPE